MTIWNRGLVDAIRLATDGNFALGDSRFGEEIGRALGRRGTLDKSGRPRMRVHPMSGDLIWLGQADNGGLSLMALR